MTEGVGDGEGAADVAVLLFGDVVEMLEGGDEEGDDEAIDVVDGGAEEEEGEDDPAEAGEAAR